LIDCLTKTDCRPNEISEIECFHATDAKRTNFSSKLIEADRTIFYDWGLEHYRYNRGSALIFHDDPHICQAFSIAESFKNLDYAVKIFSTGEIMTQIGIELQINTWTIISFYILRKKEPKEKF
jgi:hypothetical protein